jgi:hypothetical protein
MSKRQSTLNMDGAEILLGMPSLRWLKFHQQGDELIISME